MSKSVLFCSVERNKIDSCPPYRLHARPQRLFLAHAPLKVANNEFRPQIFIKLLFSLGISAVEKWFEMKNEKSKKGLSHTYLILYYDQIFGWLPIHLLQLTLETRNTNNVTRIFDEVILMRNEKFIPDCKLLSKEWKQHRKQIDAPSEEEFAWWDKQVEMLPYDWCLGFPRITSK